jgi:hypothetical protein
MVENFTAIIVCPTLKEPLGPEGMMVAIRGFPLGDRAKEIEITNLHALNELYGGELKIERLRDKLLITRCFRAISIKSIRDAARELRDRFELCLGLITEIQYQ